MWDRWNIHHHRLREEHLCRSGERFCLFLQDTKIISGVCIKKVNINPPVDRTTSQGFMECSVECFMGSPGKLMRFGTGRSKCLQLNLYFHERFR